MRKSDILRNINVNILSGNRVIINKQWNNPRINVDPFARLYWVEEGTAQLEYKGQIWTLAHNQAYLLPTYAPLRVIDSPNAKLFFMHMTVTLLNNINLFSLVNCPFSIVIANKEMYKAYFSGLVDEVNVAYKKNPLAIQGYINLLLAPFFEEENITLKKEMEQLMLFNHIIEYIDNHINKKITLEELAQIMRMHPNYFSSIFKDFFEISPQKYIINKRIEKAQLLMYNSSLTLKEIAATVGYHDICYFSRLFKKETGVTPKSYKNMVSGYGSTTPY